MREFIEDGFIKIEFVRSTENESDVFTKNVNQETYQKHMKKFLSNSVDEDTGWTLQDRKGIGDIPYVHQKLVLLV